MSVSNISVMLMHITSRYTGYVSKAWGEAWVMRIGGIWGVLTAISAFLYMYI